MRSLPRWLPVLIAALTACAGIEGADAPAGEGDAPPAAGGGQEPAMPAPVVEVDEQEPGTVAWRYRGMVEGLLPDNVTALAATTSDELRGLVARTDVADPGPVDWDREFVLLLAQPDDLCPDTLVGLDAVDGVVEPSWLAPPGGCAQPLIWRIHTVVVHRGHLTGPTTFVVPEPYRRDVTVVTLDLPSYDGEVPAPPQRDEQMSSDALDAVFAGHPVARCEPLPDAPTTGGDDRDDDPEADDRSVESERIDRVMTFLNVHPDWDAERDVMPILDIWGDGRFHLRVAAERAEELRADLEEEFGPDVAIIDAVDPGPAELLAVQDALGPLHGGSGPGSISYSAGLSRRLQVEVGMIDPTREALDAIAELVDPRHVCVVPVLSGVVVGDG